MGIKHKHVVVIDDDDYILDMLNKVLVAAGMYAEFATTTDLGFQIINRTVPHCIILDLEVDNNKGLDLITKIQACDFLQNIPIVVLTAVDDEKIISKIAHMGVKEYAKKPLSSQDLMRKVRKVCKDFCFPDKEFAPEECPDAKMALKGQLARVNEVSCILQSSVKIKKGTIMSLECQFLEKLKINCDFKSIRESFTANPRVYETELTFLGLDETMSKEVRKYCHTKVR